MKPDFNDEENFVIAYYRDKNVSSASRANLLECARVLVAICFFTYGLVGGDLLWSVIGFGMLIFGEIKRMLETSKYTQVFRNIFRKYDEALDGKPDPDEEGSV